MNCASLLAIAAATTAILLSTNTLSYAEEDACAGQSWPNLSDDCITQIVKKVCEAGGGSDCTGGESSSVTIDHYFEATGSTSVRITTKTPTVVHKKRQ